MEADKNNVVLNETPVTQLNIHRPVIGQPLTFNGQKEQIIGCPLTNASARNIMSFFIAIMLLVAICKLIKHEAMQAVISCIQKGAVF